MINESDVTNKSAIQNPVPGDFWHERFSPYFMVVAVKGDAITVLSCLSHGDHRRGEPNARINNEDGTWSFDPSKYMVVNRQWMIDAVTYRKSVESGFCADVSRSERNNGIATEWRRYRAKQLLAELNELGSDVSAMLLEEQ